MRNKLGIFLLILAAIILFPSAIQAGLNETGVLAVRFDPSGLEVIGDTTYLSLEVRKAGVVPLGWQLLINVDDLEAESLAVAQENEKGFLHWSGYFHFEAAESGAYFMIADDVDTTFTLVPSGRPHFQLR